MDLFFVLSGFILAYTYPRISGGGEALRVILYRIGRIWPLHLAMLLVFAALVFDPANPLHEPWRVLCSVFLVQSWVGAYGLTFAGNSVAWTLSCELFFYLAFPFLTMLSSRMIIVVTVMVSVLTILWASWVAAFTAGSEET